MNSQERTETIAELRTAHQRGRFTPTQINKLKVVSQSLDDSRFDVKQIEFSLTRQVHELQTICPHPFRFITWNERIPAGQVKGICELCGDSHIWFHTYPKKQRDTVRFE